MANGYQGLKIIVARLLDQGQSAFCCSILASPLSGVS